MFSPWGMTLKHSIFFSELTWELETTLAAWFNSTVNLSHWPDTPTHLPLFFMSHCSFDFLSYYGRYHHSLYICISVLLSAHTAVNMETCDQIWLIKSEQESPVSHSNGGSLCSIFIIFVSWHGNFRCHFPDDLAPRWMCAHSTQHTTMWRKINLSWLYPVRYWDIYFETTDITCIKTNSITYLMYFMFIVSSQ